MPDTPGDPAVARIFGFPGLEAIIRITLKYVNLLRIEQGDPVLSYEEFRAEIEAKMNDIKSGTI